MASYLLRSIVFMSIITLSVGVICRTQMNGLTSFYKYCKTGCCGNTYYSYCCPLSTYTTTSSTIGIIIGVVFVASLIVCCVVCCIRCSKSSRGFRGRTIHQPQPQLTIISTGQTNAGFRSDRHYASQPQAPPAYTPKVDNDTTAPPPSYEEATQSETTPVSQRSAS